MMWKTTCSIIEHLNDLVEDSISQEKFLSMGVGTHYKMMWEAMCNISAHINDSDGNYGQLYA